MVTGQVREVMGLPRANGRRTVLIAAVVDSLGSGLFVPFAVLYFLRTTSLPLVTVGVGLSVAAAAVIVLVPLTGMAVDRFGAIGCVVAANLLQAAGFLGYLWVTMTWQLMLFALLVAAGRRLFWTANGAFVALVSDPGEQTRWFALLRALRNGGFAFGAALAAAGAVVGTPAVYHLLVVGNAVSFLLAGLLVACWCRSAARHPSATADQTVVRIPPRTTRRGVFRVRGVGYRGVLRDHPFLLLVVANFVFVLCGLVLDVLLTIYVTGPLHRPAWLPSLAFTLNGVLVVAAQTTVTRRIQRYRPTSMLYLSTALWLAAFLVLWLLALAPAAAIVPGLLVAILAVTAAEIVCMPILNSLALALAPAGQRGRYFAVQGLTWVVPQAIAPAAFTWLFTQGTTWPWISLIIACAVNIGVLSRLHRILPVDIDRPEHATQPQP